MVKLTLSANAGGALQLGQHRLLIDALHVGKLPGFSTLDHSLRQQIFEHPDFVNPELICLTHTHPDHYSEALIQKARMRWPSAKLSSPEGEQPVTCGDLQLTYIPLPHEGAEYENVPHFGILIQCQGKHILIPGDCRLADNALVQAVAGISIDLAILNFPWLTLKKGRECLETVLQPKHCVFWHLPFAGDDINGYRRSAEAALLHYPGQLLYHPLQAIELDI